MSHPLFLPAQREPQDQSRGQHDTKDGHEKAPQGVMPVPGPLAKHKRRAPYPRHHRHTGDHVGHGHGHFFLVSLANQIYTSAALK